MEKQPAIHPKAAAAQAPVCAQQEMKTEELVLKIR
jgi:hypothetical protein